MGSAEIGLAAAIVEQLPVNAKLKIALIFLAMNWLKYQKTAS